MKITRLRRNGFTLIELLVVIAVIAILMAILMPTLAMVKDRARMIGCMANLKQWSLIATMYAQDNDGRFWSGTYAGGVGTAGYYWPWQLEDRLKDWKTSKMWFCPSAKKPITDEDGISTPTFNIWNAWGIFTEAVTCQATHRTYKPSPHGMSGSYTINGYILNISSLTGPGATFERSGVPAKNGWTAYNAPGASNIPLFADSVRFDAWPIETDWPMEDEFAAWQGDSDMGRICINRHRGFTGSAFMDLSARKVGLKELWTLKWHRQFKTTGPWTVAGNVQPESWPEWMRSFKDY